MQYVSRPTLDRATGDMVSQPLGEWITVTELGALYGAGPKRVRFVLHHIGLLQQEKGRFRLTPQAVKDGLGKRIEKGPRVKFPFDVLSPAGQAMVAGKWREACEELATLHDESRDISRASAALREFTERRKSQMETQMQVCWLLDHFPDLSQREIAEVVEVAQPLVARYTAKRREQLDFSQRRKAPTPEDEFVGPMPRNPPGSRKPMFGDVNI